MIKTPQADIGVFGGSGLYSFFENSESFKIDTPYGLPSAEITVAEIDGKKVAFLPRHGSKHQYPPHKIPYQANLYAFKKLGVKKIIAPCAAGSLSPQVKPGDFVILDQFVNFTKDRADTFYDGPKTVHIASANPYCPSLRQTTANACKKLNINFHYQGTVVVVNGPRFSTGAESKFFMSQGWQIINMTQYPEVILAREQEICFLGIALITDWDAGLAIEGKVEEVDFQTVINVFNDNISRSRDLISEIIKNINVSENCPCQEALKNAVI